ncbi:MAG TPA: helix-turn-helix domain-containing protein [Elusimicrobiales bacterium]|nr:helix-turn-helix domain-containing protein [Elusimicrobiales bacterium]
MKTRKPARRAAAPADPALTAQIVAAAHDLFAGYGFQRVKMDDVAGKLGISKKTLYLHFRSKEVLFEAAINTTLAGWKDRYAAIKADRSRNCIGKLREVTTFISHCYSLMSRPLAEDVARFAPRAWAGIEELRRDIVFTALAGLLDQGVREGLFEKDVNRELGLVLYYEFSRNVLTPDFIARYPYSATQVNDAMTRMFFDRLLTARGRAQLKEKL